MFIPNIRSPELFSNPSAQCDGKSKYFWSFCGKGISGETLWALSWIICFLGSNKTWKGLSGFFVFCLVFWYYLIRKSWTSSYFITHICIPFLFCTYRKELFLRCRGYKDTDWIKFCTYPTHQSSPEVNCESWNVFPTCCESAAAHESLEPKVSCVKTTGFTQDCFVWIPSWMAFMFFHFKLRKNYMKMEEKTKEGFLQIEKQNPVS